MNNPDTTDKDLKKNYTAALVIIGNEILTGRTQDTNANWLAQQLLSRGVRMKEVRIVPDEEESIINTVRELADKVDYVITTGGIGPTHDDITAGCIAKAFGVSLETHPEAYKVLEAFYGVDDFTPSRQKMAQIPVGARLIHNPVSAAPGFNIGNVYVLAGVPRIMRAMYDHVLDMIEVGDPVLSNTVSCGLPESVIAQDLADLQASCHDIEIGSYPHYRGGVLGLSIVLRGTSEEPLEDATRKVISLIRKYGEEPRALSIRDEKILLAEEAREETDALSA
ncbi:MAG: competence/damage-inducible protein A [Rhodospirillales bacterium]|nr:competence/damage-inducible protein A [Rhodospirillales bacterium]MCB9964725.1 competence/damage-inducible protein A [Rhodospirillales bacterium]MCB9980627.1 competence/damage-inducible protein A [Rhodospirillales bacterium]